MGMTVCQARTDAVATDWAWAWRCGSWESATHSRGGACDPASCSRDHVAAGARRVGCSCDRGWRAHYRSLRPHGGSSRHRTRATGDRAHESSAPTYISPRAGRPPAPRTSEIAECRFGSPRTL